MLGKKSDERGRILQCSLGAQVRAYLVAGHSNEGATPTVKVTAVAVVRSGRDTKSEPQMHGEMASLVKSLPLST